MGLHEPPVRQQPLRDALRELLADAIRFAKAELNLVKEEGKEAAKRGGIGAGLAFFALLLFQFVVIFAFGALAVAIGEWLGHAWLGWLIVAGGFLILTLIVGLVGFRMIMSAKNEAVGAATTVKEDLAWVKELTKRSESGS